MIIIADIVIFDGPSDGAMAGRAVVRISLSRPPRRMLLIQLHLNLHPMRPHLSLLLQLRTAKILRATKMRSIRESGVVPLRNSLRSELAGLL